MLLALFVRTADINKISLWNFTMKIIVLNLFWIKAPVTSSLRVTNKCIRYVAIIWINHCGWHNFWGAISGEKSYFLLSLSLVEQIEMAGMQTRMSKLLCTLVGNQRPDTGGHTSRRAVLLVQTYLHSGDEVRPPRRGHHLNQPLVPEDPHIREVNRRSCVNGCSDVYFIMTIRSRSRE